MQESTQSSGKRKRNEPLNPILAQTGMYAPPTLWARGGTSDFAKSERQNYNAKRRAEMTQTSIKEDGRRRVEKLLLEEGHRVRRAGGVPFTAEGGLASRQGSRAPSEGVSAGNDESEAINSDIGARLIPALLHHAEEQQEREGLDTARTLVIQPGSRYLRVGRSTDHNPLELPSCIYRKVPLKQLQTSEYRDVPPMTIGFTPKLENILNSPTTSGAELSAGPSDKTDTPNGIDKADQIDEKEHARVSELIDDMRDNLKARMQAAKLKLPGKYENYMTNTRKYNSSVKAVHHKAYDDPYGVDWVEDWSEDTLFPTEDLHVPEEAPYECRWPWSRRSLNTEGYRGTNPELLLGDIQAILANAFNKLDPPVERSEYYQYSIALIMPDHVEKQYIEATCKVLFQYMGFKQIGLLQGASCATFGAGLSTACIVDVGAQRSSVTCVDDGFIMPESRYILNYGTDDVTDFYAELLKRIAFPYAELRMSRRSDRAMMDDLRIRTCVLQDHYVANNVWKFNLKGFKRPSIEYECQTFDQPILAYSCLFDPRVMNWKQKDKFKRYPLKGYVDEFMTEIKDDDVTRAMAVATEHLLPPPPPPPAPTYEEVRTIDPETGQETITPVLLPPPPPPLIEPDFNVVDEAAKLPLEVAVACSVLTATPDRRNGLSSSILILGGAGAVDGFSEALRWRVLSQLQQRVPAQMIIPEIIPAPRGLDPRLVTWRGGVVWTKLDSMQEVWIRREEWNEIGIRAWKMRSM